MPLSVTDLSFDAGYDLDGQPTGTVHLDFDASGLQLLYLVLVLTETPPTETHWGTAANPRVLTYGPFTDKDTASAWADTHIAPYDNRYMIAPLAVPYTHAEADHANGHRPMPARPAPRAARADVVAKELKGAGHTRLRRDARNGKGFTAHSQQHPDHGTVTEVTFLSVEMSLPRLQLILRAADPSYEVRPTAAPHRFLVRRKSLREMTDAADRAALLAAECVGPMMLNRPETPATAASTVVASGSSADSSEPEVTARTTATRTIEDTAPAHPLS